MTEKNPGTHEATIRQHVILSYEDRIFQETKGIISPGSQILIVGDPNLAIANLYSGHNRTIIEGDHKIYEAMKIAAQNMGVTLLEGVYPFDIHTNKYDLIVLKNVISFNQKNPDFISKTIEDLAPDGNIVITESVPYRNKIPRLLDTNNLIYTQKDFAFLNTGTIFLAHPRSSP